MENNNNNNNKGDEVLRSLNKLSHKISKPTTNTRIKPNPQPDECPDSEPVAPPHQPPVYNINKNDFRDVVQKLTGSPSHPLPPPKPVSSRLHRIRPPPLAPLTINTVVVSNSNSNSNAPPFISPLPPFPSVHAAAESPISAYLRFFQASGNVFLPQSPLAFGCHPSPMFSPPPPVSPVPSPGKNE